MFGKQKKPAFPAFDWTGMVPVVRASICTGERVAGFKEPSSGKFHDLALIRSDAELREFLRAYGVEESALKKEW